MESAMVQIFCTIALFGALGIHAQNTTHQNWNEDASAATPSGIRGKATLLRKSNEEEEPPHNVSSAANNTSPMINVTLQSIEYNEDSGYYSYSTPAVSFQEDGSNVNETARNPTKSTDRMTTIRNTVVNNSSGTHSSTDTDDHITELTPFDTLAGKAAAQNKDAFPQDTLATVGNIDTEMAVITPGPAQNNVPDINKEKNRAVTEMIKLTITGNSTRTTSIVDVHHKTVSNGNADSTLDQDVPLNGSHHSPDTDTFEALRFDEDDHSHSPRSENPLQGNSQNAETENTTNLCSSCLCDSEKTNVFCKHQHVRQGSVHHLELHSGMIPKTATFLKIADFDSVKIMKGTFDNQDLELRNIQFTNINQVQLVKESLLFDAKARSNREVAVSFTDCNITEIPTETFTQYARSEDQKNDIDLENTRFLTLQIIRCNISTIRSYALTQARLLYFKMSHSQVKVMEEHSFHVDVYEDWVMESNHLPKLMPHTICLRSQMLVIFSNNVFTAIENRSLEIASNTQVLFEFNRVFYLGSEALVGITPTGRGSNLVFMNNTVFKLGSKSLLISNRYPLHERKILDNNFNILCECQIKEKFLPFMDISHLSSHHDNLTYRKLMESSSCRRYAASNIYNNIEEYLTNNCAPVPLPIIVSAAAVVTVVIITIIVCIVCTKRAEKAKEEANYLGECCYSHSFSTLNSGNPASMSSPFSACSSWERSKQLQPWVIAVPEVKTYQETEVNVRYEQTDPLNASLRGSYQEPTIDFQQRAGVRASCPFN
ncbi:uncharacterized protein LOC135224512 [Macrobrachium nipponense]|uniref:uncharacterized protein LOC135224512 n=1 Tax=Macrobrachium nipponense TaxID=159736 RepID=UPI0030C8CC31